MYYPFFIALAKQTHRAFIKVYILHIQPNELTKTHSAVYKKSYDTIITKIKWVICIHIFKQIYAFVQSKEFRKMLVHFRIVHIFCRVAVDNIQITVKAFEKHSQRGKLSVTCFGCISSYRSNIVQILKRIKLCK